MEHFLPLLPMAFVYSNQLICVEYNNSCASHALLVILSRKQANECQFHYLTDIVKLVCLQHISFISIQKKIIPISSSFFELSISFVLCVQFLLFSYILWALQLALTAPLLLRFFTVFFCCCCCYSIVVSFSSAIAVYDDADLFCCVLFFLLFIFARFRHKPNKKIWAEHFLLLYFSSYNKNENWINEH